MSATQKDFVVRAGIQAPANSSFGDSVAVAHDVDVTQNVAANNLSVRTGLGANTLSTNTLTVSANATIANASIVNLVANTGSINTLSSSNATILSITANTIGGANLAITAKTGAFTNVSANSATMNALTVQDLTVTGNTSLAFERGTMLRSYREYVAANTTPANTYVVDLLDSNIFNLSISANTAITLDNVANSGIAVSFTLIVKKLVAGARITFPANTVWSEGIVPVQSTGLNQTDVFTFMTLNAGAMIIGAHAFANVS